MLWNNPKEKNLKKFNLKKLEKKMKMTFIYNLLKIKKYQQIKLKKKKTMKMHKNKLYLENYLKKN